MGLIFLWITALIIWHWHERSAVMWDSGEFLPSVCNCKECFAAISKGPDYVVESHQHRRLSSLVVKTPFTFIGRPRKKAWFFMAKTMGSFSRIRDFFPEDKNHEKQGNFAKSVIYRDQKSKKLPSDRHNERAVVRILIENGAEISGNSALAWHCVRGIFLDGCFKLTRLSLWTVFSTCVF